MLTLGYNDLKVDMKRLKVNFLKFRIKLRKVSRLPIIKFFFKKEEKKFGSSEIILIVAVLTVISMKFYDKLQTQLNIVNSSCIGLGKVEPGVDELN